MADDCEFGEGEKLGGGFEFGVWLAGAGDVEGADTVWGEDANADVEIAGGLGANDYAREDFGIFHMVVDIIYHMGAIMVNDITKTCWELFEATGEIGYFNLFNRLQESEE